jgi:hypothetical protein
MIAEPSLRSLLIEPRVHGIALGTATGFVVQRERAGRAYLVTNWHVVTGRRPDTGELLSHSGGVPDELAILHHVAGRPEVWDYKVERLCDANGDPRWLEHPEHGRRVDVVAFELLELSDVRLRPYDLWTPGPELALNVAAPVSIIGFPFGITGGKKYGVWVQGTLATEPSLNFDDLPCFLVDSRTRPGQSGSPVISYYAPGTEAPLAGGNAGWFAGEVVKFEGVYSGRINERSDLGHVWKAGAVRDIVESQARGHV